MLTTAVLVRTYGCKAATAQAWLPLIEAASRFCEVDRDANRLAAFLAQVGHESGRLRYTREIWGPTAQQLRYEYGTPLAKQLGNFRPGDGARYRGRGLIQVTGRLNYQLTTRQMQEAFARHASLPDLGAAAAIPDFEAEPEALERPLWAAMSAALYWLTRRLNVPADAHDFVTLTRRINGGINGLADRQALYAAAFAALV